MSAPFAYFWSPSLKKLMWTCSWQSKGQRVLLCGSHQLPHLPERFASPHHSSASLNLSPFLRSAPHSLQRPDFFVPPKTECADIKLALCWWDCSRENTDRWFAKVYIQLPVLTSILLGKVSKCLKSSACSWSAPHGQAPQVPISCNKVEASFSSSFLLSF